MPGNTAGLSLCAFAGEALQSCNVVPLWDLASIQIRVPSHCGLQSGRLSNARQPASLADSVAAATRHTIRTQEWHKLTNGRPVFRSDSHSRNICGDREILAGLPADSVYA